MNLHKPTTRALKQINLSNVLKRIYFEAPISRQELSRRTKLSPATVTNLVVELIERGIVVESGYEESEGGRPRALLAIDPSYGYFIGVDAGETLIQIELFDLALHNLRLVHQPLSLEENQPSQVVDHIVHGVETLMNGAGVGPEKVIGVGIGFPGLVDPASGISIFAPNWGWHDVPVGTLIEERLGLPLLLDNGAKAMALAESMFGAGKGTDSLAVLLVGTGIGAGVIHQGSIYRGVTNSAGEWGHMTIELDGLPCRCGSRGCLEAYAGAPGILHRYFNRVPDSPLRQQENQMQALQALLNLSRQGDAAAREVISETARYLGVGVANLINLFNPQIVALGGWAGLMMGPEIFPELLATVERYALDQALQRTRLYLCKLGQEAVTLGAAVLALEAFLESAGSKRFIRTALS